MDEVLTSIIIVNYKTQYLVLDTIESIIQQTINISYEIIVVDNDSKDNSRTLIYGRYKDTVTYMSLPDNLGFGKANNEGAKVAKGKYLFFLNPDTILISNAVYFLSIFMENNPSTGICGGNLFTKELKPTHSCMPIQPSVFLELDSLLNHIPLILAHGIKFDFNTSDKPLKVADIIGADIMIRADLFRTLNGFDPDFFLYFEETELAYRVQKSGYSVYSVPDAKIIHLEGKSSESKISERKYALISRKLYYKKTQKFANRIIIDLIFMTKCIVLIFCSIVSFNKAYVKYWLFALKNGMIELW
ncbi:MAG: glycosyltransferase family 2 protein [Paludibacteraceae bacterium]